MNISGAEPADTLTARPPLSRCRLTALITLLLIGLLALAFIQRINPVRHWDMNPDKYLIGGEPMLTNFDGYFYLETAREILADTYTTTETHRGFPDTIKRSAIPPLLSVLLAAWTKATGISLNWAAVFLPCIFSLLIAIPVYYLARRWCGPGTAVLAVGLTLLSPYYASRTGLGVLDTDCLNAMFALNAVYPALLFAGERDRKRWLWALCCLVNYLLYLWWWDQTFTAPTILGLGLLLVAVLLYYRPSRREGLLAAAATAMAFLAAGLFFDFDRFTGFLSSAWSSLQYISKQQGLYLNVGETITEQKPLGLGELAAYTILVPTCFHLAIIGFFWLLARVGKEMLLCLPLFIVASFTVLFAGRFAIFTVPVVALGFSAFIFLAADLFRKRSIRAGQIIYGAGIAYCLYAGLTFFLHGTTRFSFYPAATVAGMQGLRTTTEKEAVIWSWWDEGHPLVYWAQRTTLGDGMIHGGQRNHCLAFPFTVTDDRLAANFIRFYLTNGLNGLNRFYNEAKELHLDGETLLPTLLAAGPESARKHLEDVPETTRKQWVKDLFPNPSRPVYLFISEKMLRSTDWIFVNGGWNTKTRSAPKYLPAFWFEVPEDVRLTGLPRFKNFSVDPLSLTLTLPQAFKSSIPLQRVVITDEKKSIRYNAPAWYKGMVEPEFVDTENITNGRNTASGAYQLDIYLPDKRVVVQDTRGAESVINRLFWRKGAYDGRYFQPVQLRTPYYQVWKVIGDRR